jgi:hypothetical protein
MLTLFISACSHCLVLGMPLIAALWGMVLVAYGYEWTLYRRIVQGARLAPATAQCIVIEQLRDEYVNQIRCQAIVTRRYCR